MHKNYFIVFFLFCICVVSPIASQSVPGDFQVQLTRTECFGECPSYTVIIYASGRAVFHGKNYIKKKGISEEQISPEKIRILIDEFNRVKYFSMLDEYTPQQSACTEAVTDFPSAITSLTMNGQSKKVTHYHGCRGSDVLKELAILENKIDEIAGTKKWIE